VRPQPHRDRPRGESRPARAPGPADLRGPDLRRARVPHHGVGRRARADRALLPDQPRGSARRAPAHARRARGRHPHQPGRVDALRVGDPRSAGDRRPARGRGALVEPLRPGGVASPVGDRGAVPGHGERSGTGRLPRGPGAHQAGARWL
ncbi:MAG: 3-dehydroquinate dehydratase II, partial [uncultured Solirubrobacteraceae bacterium]